MRTDFVRVWWNLSTHVSICWESLSVGNGFTVSVAQDQEIVFSWLGLGSVLHHAVVWSWQQTRCNPLAAKTCGNGGQLQAQKKKWYIWPPKETERLFPFLQRDSKVTKKWLFGPQKALLSHFGGHKVTFWSPLSLFAESLWKRNKSLFSLLRVRSMISFFQACSCHPFPQTKSSNGQAEAWRKITEKASSLSMKAAGFLREAAVCFLLSNFKYVLAHQSATLPCLPDHTISLPTTHSGFWVMPPRSWKIWKLQSIEGAAARESEESACQLQVRLYQQSRVWLSSAVSLLISATPLCSECPMPTCHPGVGI